MRKDQLAEEAHLYFGNYAVIQYVNNELRPAAEKEVAAKLSAARDTMVRSLEQAGFLTSIEHDRLGVYVSDEWLNAEDVDVGVFLALYPDFKDTGTPSKIGVTALNHDGAHSALKQAKKDAAPWLQDLAEAHGRQLSDQLYRDLDWYDEFETFEEMTSALTEEVKKLAEGLQDLMAEKGIALS